MLLDDETESKIKYLIYKLQTVNDGTTVHTRGTAIARLYICLAYPDKMSQETFDRLVELIEESLISERWDLLGVFLRA